MKPKAKKKLLFYLLIFFCIFLGYCLIIKTFEENIIFFVSPKDINLIKHSGKIIRVGGIVKEGSVISTDDQQHEFVLSDLVEEVKVLYKGILPNLFREKQGIIAKGKLSANGEKFFAEEILAKHDEKYIPKELQDTLKKTGQWRDN